MIFLQQHDFDVTDDLDLINFLEAISSFYFAEWRCAMKKKIKPMYKNNVWDLEELPIGCKPIRTK